MHRILRLFAVIVVLFLIAILWFWWNRPKPVDMAANVPADSMVYLEANSLSDVAGAIAETDTWQRVAPKMGFTATKKRDDWLTYLTKMTGLGSASAVIAARAQIAFVLLDLNSAGNGDALEFKSQAALIVETHTSSARVKPVMESAIGSVAARVYVHPKVEHVTVEGSELTRWIAPDGQRRIIAAVDGSLVVVGSDERAVAACLAARHGQRPSLLRQAELQEMRSRLKADEALAFGYTSSANAGRLVAVGAPMVFGKLLEEPQLQKLLAVGATNLLGNVGWSALRFKGGIQDSYLIDLKPDVAARLHSTFVSSEQRLEGGWEFVPEDTESVSTYNIRDPAAAWESFAAVVSSHLDVLSAVLFTTKFREVLIPYGIDQPENFLKGIKPEILTVRIGPRAERAVVIARIADPDVVRNFVTRRFGVKPHVEKVGDEQYVVSPDEGFAASFVGDYFLLGAPDDVRRCLSARAAHNAIISSSRVGVLTPYLDRPGSVNVVTYASDAERTRAFINTVATMRGSQASTSSAEIDRVIAGLPFATTETNLGDNGFERRTRSAFGQFTSLVSFLSGEIVSTAP